MADPEIRSSLAAVGEQASTLEVTISACNEISFQELAGATSGIAGSDAHDQVASSFATSLAIWDNLVCTDAAAIRSAGSSFANTDDDAARALSAHGGGSVHEG